MNPEQLFSALQSQQIVSAADMQAGGFSKPVLDVAAKLGLNWTALVTLFLKYGPMLLQILQDLIAHQEPS